MTMLLYLAAFFTFAIGVSHSVLGERYILIRLFKRDNIPHLFGGPEFTINTLRFAWHITTIFWWGLAAILVLIAENALSEKAVLIVVAVTFLISGFISLVASKAKHYSWVIFLFIGFACLYVSQVK